MLPPSSCQEKRKEGNVNQFRNLSHSEEHNYSLQDMKQGPLPHIWCSHTVPQYLHKSSFDEISQGQSLSLRNKSTSVKDLITYILKILKSSQHTNFNKHADKHKFLNIKPPHQTAILCYLHWTYIWKHAK